MPLFLDARAKNSPDAFTNADENATYLGRVSKGINTVFLNEHTMMFINRKSPETYGELIPWSENDKAFEWMMSKKGMNPGQGLLTMEVQERVFKFLVAYCRLVLHDIPAEKLTSDDYPVLLRPNVPTETGDGFASLGVMAAEAPYRAPDRMDLAKMESLLDAKASAAEDHIWALREDPSYFADVLLEYKEHRQEILKDTKGRAHPVFTIPQHDVFWQRAVGTTISAAHRDVEVWNELLSQVKHLRRLESKYAAAISIEKDLPEKFVNALLRFRWYLEQCSLGPKNEIKLIAAPSPPLRQYFVRKPPQDPMSSIIEMEAKLNRNLNKIQAEFWWLLQTLLEDGQQLFFLRLTNLVDELDRLIQSEPDAKEMVSGYLARILEDLAVFSEGLKQNQLFQPWAQSLDYIMADRIGDMKREFNEHIQRCGDHLAALRGSDTMRALALGAPTDGKFYYPVDKRRTKENVDFMRKAESDLDQFWTGVDDILRRNAGDKLDGTALGRLLSQSRSLQRTAPWIEKMQALTSKTSEPDVELPMKPLSELYLNLQQKEGTTGREVLKENVPTSTKAKTRGAATSAVAAEDHQHLPPSELPDEQPLFPVDARSLKVFRTLFYTPSVNANPGEVPWTDFLHAMQLLVSCRKSCMDQCGNSHQPNWMSKGAFSFTSHIRAVNYHTRLLTVSGEG